MKVVAIFDTRNILIYGQMAFYLSTGTSGPDIAADINILRSGTYFPIFGAAPNGQLIKPVAIQPVDAKAERSLASYEIPRGKVGDKNDLLCDEPLFVLYQRGLLSNDMISRFRFHDAMIMSAMLGGDFWESKNGQIIIAELKMNCEYFKPVTIEGTVDSSIPVFNDDDDKDAMINAQEFNDFLRKNGVLLSGHANTEHFIKCKEKIAEREAERARLIAKGDLEQLNEFNRKGFFLFPSAEIDPQSIPAILRNSILHPNGGALSQAGTQAGLYLSEGEDKYAPAVKSVPIWARICK